MDLSICSYNVRGLGNKTKREQIFAWLKTNNFSICLLQETHSGDGTHELWKREWGNDAFFCGQSNSKEGIGILINPNLSYTVQKHTKLIDGRLQALEIQINDKEISLINIYGPNVDDTTVLEKMDEYISNNQDKSYIIGGDFNTVLNEKMDKKIGRTDTHKLCRNKIKHIIETFNLIDIWRVTHPSLRQYTWHSSHKPPIFCRLDYFLISENLRNYVISSKHTTSYKSDHSLVTLCIDMINISRGPGYFKINNSLLLDAEYKDIINKNIDETASLNSNANPNTLWELIKGTVRNETIKYATKKKKELNKREDKLKNEIEELQNIISGQVNDDRFETYKTELQKKTTELEALTDIKLNGLIIRSKANIVEHSEKNTKYFANLEKKRSESKVISRLHINNTTTTDQKQILSETENYYRALYTKRETQNARYDFFDDSIDKLSGVDQEKCDGLITELECAKALKEMKNQKSPGSDGITVEFYKLFWNKIKSFYLNSINYSFEIGSLTELQKQSIITLIPKQNKDITSLDNWRPISLLNVDYKIASKVIANRIKQVITKIIDNSQTGFIKGGYIGENIRLLFEVIDNCEDENKPGLIFFSDFEKAFDSLDHTYMTNCLKHFNFGESFLRWIQLFYKDAKSCVSNNGSMSNFFSIERGVRQGCPLSPYLFIICIELLSNKISTVEDIKGIRLVRETFKKSLFADDASFILDGSIRSFERLIDVLDNFSYVSGLKLNTKKCQVLRIGSLIKTEVTFLRHRQFKWSSQEASALGMTFTTNKYNIFQANLEPKINDFETCLKQWQHRKLTLMGKVTVIKNFALPKLIYAFSSLPNPPKETLKRIEKIMYNFLWDGKPERIKRDILIGEYEKGGLKMIDIQLFIKSLKVSWIKRILESDNNGMLNKMYLSKLRPFGDKLVFECNISENDINQFAQNNTFLKDILRAWINFASRTAILSYRNEILWNNSYIRTGENTIMYLNWYNNGIKYIKDIYNDEAKRFYTFDRLKQLYNLHNNDFLKYLTIVHSIPNRWKMNIQNENIDTPLQPSIISQIIKSKQTNKYVYDALRKSVIATEKRSEQKWEEEFKEETFSWKKIYSVSLLSTKDIKLQNFQYKHLFRIIPTNKFLFKCNIEDSALCDFCSMNIQTLNHLFWECPQVQHFWSEVSNFMSSYDITITFTLHNIIFGILSSNAKPETQVRNFIILLGKYFIFKNKCQKKPVLFTQFKSYFKQRLKIEKEIYFIKDRIAQFDKKWDKFKTFIT